MTGFGMSHTVLRQQWQEVQLVAEGAFSCSIAIPDFAVDPVPVSACEDSVSAKLFRRLIPKQAREMGKSG